MGLQDARNGYLVRSGVLCGPECRGSVNYPGRDPVLTITVIQGVFNNRCQDDFHGKAHFACRHYDGVAS